MTPVRVITPGASPTLPLRMVAAGTGVDVSIVLYVIAEGQYATQNFPSATLDFSQLAWNWSLASSNYATLQQKALGSNGFLTSFALPRGLRAQILQTDGTPASFYASGPETLEAYADFADLYFGEAAGDAGMMDTCTAIGAAIDAVAPGAKVVEAMGTPPAGTVASSTFSCNGFDDVATALVGMHPSDVWITRLEADLTRSALAQDLTLSASRSQAPVPSWHLAPTSIGSPCPPSSTIASPPPSHGSSCAAGRRPALANTSAGALAALGLGLLIRRRARRRA
jgi:hypothetical protein